MFEVTSKYAKSLAKKFSCEHKISPSESDLIGFSDIEGGHCFAICNFLAQCKGSLRTFTDNFDDHKRAITATQAAFEDSYRLINAAPEMVMEKVYKKYWLIDDSCYQFHPYSRHVHEFLFYSILNKVSSKSGLWFLQMQANYSHAIMFIYNEEENRIYFFEPTYGVFYSKALLVPTQIAKLAQLCIHHFNIERASIFSPPKFHVLMRVVAPVLSKPVLKIFEEEATAL